MGEVEGWLDAEGDRLQLEKLMESVERIPEAGCWIWMGYCERQGYGRVAVSRGKTVLAHRLFWQLLTGNEPRDCILHHCDVPSCVNPDHLYDGSRSDNLHDAWNRGQKTFNRSKGMAARTHCKNGHEFSLENTRLRNGARYCRACERDNQRRAVARRKANC